MQVQFPVLNILRLALYQIFYLDRVPESAAVNEAVNHARLNRYQPHIISFVNGILRNICRNKDGIKFPERGKNVVDYFCAFYSYPEWLVKKWIKELGEDFTEDLLNSQNRFPELNIRTNTLKVSRDALIKYLVDEGVEGIGL